MVPHSSLKCNSKFPVGMSKFPVQIRNFQLDEVEISSWNVEISSWNVEMSSLKKSKFPVRTRNFQLECRNFQFEEVEISSSNSKFPVQTMVNEPIRWNNYITNQQLEISTSSNWKFRVQSGNFEFQTGYFDFGKLKISTSQLEISTSANWKFRLRQTGNFDIPTGNFELHFRLECGTNTLSYKVDTFSMNWRHVDHTQQ